MYNLCFKRNGEYIPCKTYVDMIIEEKIEQKFNEILKAQEKQKPEPVVQYTQCTQCLSKLAELLNELVSERNKLQQESATIDECDLNAVLDVVGMKMQVDFYDEILEKIVKAIGGEYIADEWKRKIKFK